MTVDHQQAAKALFVESPDQIVDDLQKGRQTQADIAGIAIVPRSDAVSDWRRHQGAAALRGGIGQRQGDAYIGLQAQVAMLLAGTKHQEQTIILLQVTFDIHPVEIFDAHGRHPSLPDAR